MVNQKILCNLCNKIIISKKDLVVALYFLKMRAFHLNCYSDRGVTAGQQITLKIFWRMLKRSHLHDPKRLYSRINYRGFSIFATVMPFFGVYILSLLPSLFGVSVFTIIHIIFVLLVFFLPIFLRLYSYFKFEKPLNKIDR